MEHGPPESDPLGDDDPFAGFVFDEEFVQSAAIVEASAEQREREARRANLQRLLADQAAQRDNEQHAQRRFAPEDDPEFDIDPDELPPRRSARTVVAVVVVLSIFVVYTLSHFFTNGSGGADLPTTTAAPSTTAAAAVDQGSSAVDPGTSTGATATRPDHWPSPTTEESAVPLGRPPAVPEGGGPHSFVQLQSDGSTPIAYDPCRPIHYVTRTRGEPDGAADLVTDALASVSAATGLQFQDDGATDEPPSDDRASFQPERYGDRWAPVLITWSDPAESPMLGEAHEASPEGAVADVLGYAGSAPAGVEGSESALVTGAVTLDGPDFAQLLTEFDGYARARAVVLHELGHLVGLGHVDDTSQLMSPVLRSDLTEYAAGDREGLARLGQGACLAEV